MPDDSMKSSGNTTIPSGSGNAAASIAKSNELLAQMEKSLKIIAASAGRVGTNFKGTLAAVQQLKTALADLRNIEIVQSKLAPKQAADMVGPLLRVKTLTTGISEMHIGILGKMRQWRDLVNHIEQKYMRIVTLAASVHTGTQPDLMSTKNAAAVLDVSAGRSAQARSKLVSQKTRGTGTGTGSPKGDGWLSGSAQQAKYWLRLGLFYRMFDRVVAGAKSFTDMEGQVSRAVRTAVSDTTDYNEVMQARAQILQSATDYLQKHSGSLSEYTEVVYKLTEAEMARNEALKLAPTIMALAKGLDAPLDKTTELLVGLNETYQKRMPGTDSQRIEKIASMLALASKKEMASVEQITSGIGYLGTLAQQIGMPVEQLIALTARLNTNLLQGSRAGTGLRQVFSSLAKNSDKLNAAFNLGIDTSKPIDVLDVLQRLNPYLDSATVTAGTLRDLLGGIDVRALPAALVSSQQIGEIRKLAAELKNASLENVFSMRDIMETTVPANLALLSKNVDFVIASFFRGAIGGDDFRQSLTRLNAAVAALNAPLFALGRTIQSLSANKPVMYAAGLAAAWHLVAKRIAVARAAAAGMTGLGAIRTGGMAAIGGAAGLAGIGLVGAGAVLYMQERKRQRLAEQISTSQQASAEYTNEAIRLRELAGALTSTTDNTDLLAQAQAALAKHAGFASDSLGKQTDTADQLAARLNTYATALDKLARVEAANTAAGIMQKYQRSSFTAMQSNGRDAFWSDPMRVSAAVENTQRLRDVMNDIEALRDAGTKAGWTKTAISGDVEALVASQTQDLQNGIAAAQRLLAQKGKSLFLPDDAARAALAETLTQLQAAQTGMQDATKNLFAPASAKAGEAATNVQRFAAALAILRSQFAGYSPTLADQLALVDDKGLATADAYRAKVALVTQEIERLDGAMKDTRSQADGILAPASKEEFDAAQTRIEKLQKEYERQAETKYKLERDLTRMRLDNEKAIADAQQKYHAENVARQNELLANYRKEIDKARADADTARAKLFSASGGPLGKIFMGEKRPGLKKGDPDIVVAGRNMQSELGLAALNKIRDRKITGAVKQSRVYDEFISLLAEKKLDPDTAENLLTALQIGPAALFDSQRANARTGGERQMIAGQQELFNAMITAAYQNASKAGGRMPATLNQVKTGGMPALLSATAGGSYGDRLRSPDFWQTYSGQGTETGALLAQLQGNSQTLLQNTNALAALTAALAASGQPYSISAPWKTFAQPSVQPLPPASIARPGLNAGQTEVIINLDGQQISTFMLASAQQSVANARLASSAADQSMKLLNQAAAARTQQNVLTNTRV